MPIHCTQEWMQTTRGRLPHRSMGEHVVKDAPCTGKSADILQTSDIKAYLSSDACRGQAAKSCELPQPAGKSRIFGKIPGLAYRSLEKTLKSEKW